MEVKLIPLHGMYGEGKFATVDAEDYEYLSGFYWNVTPQGYAYRSEGTKKVNGKKRSIQYLMHREIMKFPSKIVDHIDGNKLNNTKSNLRVGTQKQNARNAKKPKSNTSGFKGVTWVKDLQKWNASVMVDRKQIHLGYFCDLIEAAKHYDYWAIKYHGDYANLNGLDLDGFTPTEVKRVNKSSKFRGVYFNKQTGKWHVIIKVNRKQIKLGRFDDELEAAKKYDKTAIQLLGDKAKLNFPDLQEEVTIIPVS